MPFLFVLAVAAVAVLLPAASSAQVYKCEKGGSIVYKDAPCEGADRSTRIDTPAGPGGPTGAAAWAGCYEGELSKWEGGQKPARLRVRTGARGMELTLDGEGPALPLRPFTAEERRTLERSMARDDPGVRVVDGVGVPIPVDHNDRSKGDTAAMGIYRIQQKGREVLFALLPFTGGYFRKMPCPAQ